MTGAEAPRELRDLASTDVRADLRDVWEPGTYLNERNPGGPSLPLIVRVRHCSLEHAPYRLLVGHFQGLPLSGAESRLNERSDGRLERLLLMNQYPQRLGETVVLEPVDEAPPLGMVIIGLGPSGELSAAALRSAVTRALVRVALNELDRRLAADAGAVESPWRPLGISSVLIGSSAGGGLPVEASVRALIDAVTTANARLARLRVFSGTGEVDATDVVRFDVLELTERYEDRVDLIVGVLARMQQLENQDAAASDGSVPRVTYVLAAEPGEGASSANPPIDAADEVWRRIDIRAQQGDVFVRHADSSSRRSAASPAPNGCSSTSSAPSSIRCWPRRSIDTPTHTSAARSTSCSSRTSSRVSWDPPRTCTCSSTRRQRTGRWNCCDPAPTRRTDGSRWRCGWASSGSSARPKACDTTFAGRRATTRW